MVHPTCALARLPNAPPAHEHSKTPLSAPIVLPSTLAADLSALREAYRAIACVHNLLLHVRSPHTPERDALRSDVEALVALINTEFERRVQAAKASATSMPRHS